MKKKMLQVEAETHETIKQNAYDRGMTIEGYLRHLAIQDKKAIAEESK